MKNLENKHRVLVEFLDNIWACDCEYLNRSDECEDCVDKVLLEIDKINKEIARLLLNQ